MKPIRESARLDWGGEHMGYEGLPPRLKDLVNRAVMLKHDLIKNGLFSTGQLMEPVVTKIGYEIAEKQKKKP